MTDPAGVPEMVTFSVVIPVYKNRGTLVELAKRLDELGERLPGILEVIFVSDGSPDDSVQILRALLPACGFRSRLLCLSRNFGAFAAIRSGLEEATGRWIAVMAADLQEPVELVETFFTALSSGDFDVAVGQRTSRADPFFGALASRLFWATYRRFIQPEVPPGGVDVFACTSEVRDALLALRESHSSLVGLLFWLGYRRTVVPYERRARTEGKSGWSFRRKIRYLLDSAFSFTDLPITVLIYLGSAGLLGSVVMSIAVFIAWLSGSIGVPGYTPLMLTLLVFNSLVLLGLGVVGSYVWRTFENSKQRPAYIPMFSEAFPGRR